MKTSREGYKKHIKARAGRSRLAHNLFAAYWTGGTICVLGQLMTALWMRLGADERSAGTYTCIVTIGLAAILTCLGVFDSIAKYAGGGTLVPVSGFANAVTSAALDNRSEGPVLGVGAKIFTVAGPVLLYAILSGAAYGVIYWFAESVKGWFAA